MWGVDCPTRRLKHGGADTVGVGRLLDGQRAEVWCAPDRKTHGGWAGGSTRRSRVRGSWDSGCRREGDLVPESLQLPDVVSDLAVLVKSGEVVVDSEIVEADCRVGQ
jgi:hypothetical protein